jgi:cysteine synthase A
VPYKNPNNYVKYSGRLAEALAQTHPGGAICGNQEGNHQTEMSGPDLVAVMHVFTC